MNLVVSYGDLSHQSGYRTRVLGELQFLDRCGEFDPFLLLFDRNTQTFERTYSLDIPYKALHRSEAIRFYAEVGALSRRRRIRLVHAHNLYSAALALSVRRLHGYKVILDYHGRIPEEYVFLGKGSAPSRMVLENLERWAVRKSDHVVVVSNELRKYLTERYQIADSHMTTIPCCADDRNFNWDSERRRVIRSSLDLSNKFVCTHLGSFLHWYDPELLLRVFGSIRKQIDSAHLLVVTTTVQETDHYLSSRLPVDDFTVVAAKHNEVPGLMNASDVGFLLLRPAPNIQTSSPAKFSEYLNCGLPVLISQGVGDFSALVANSRTGAVVSDCGGFDFGVIHEIFCDRQQAADRSITAGRALTWKAQESMWRQMIGRLHSSPGKRRLR